MLPLFVSISGYYTLGASSDVEGLFGFDFDLPAGATIFADKVYNLYWFEDLLQEAGISLMPIRKKNSKRPGTLGKRLAMALPAASRNSRQYG